MLVASSRWARRLLAGVVIEVAGVARGAAVAFVAGNALAQAAFLVTAQWRQAPIDVAPFSSNPQSSSDCCVADGNAWIAGDQALLVGAWVGARALLHGGRAASAKRRRPEQCCAASCAKDPPACPRGTDKVGTDEVGHATHLIAWRGVGYKRPRSSKGDGPVWRKLGPRGAVLTGDRDSE